MMYVGEVRDAESAKALMRAAGSGFLVVATGFATDILSGIDGLLRLAGNSSEVCASLAALLRIVIHQRIVDGNVRATFLASPVHYSPVANKIRMGMTAHLGTDMQIQQNDALNGRTPFHARD